MSLEKIVAIPGKGGLFKLVAQLRNGGFVVESLGDQKRYPIDMRQGVTKLQDISVYTVDGEIPLGKVFLTMKEHDAEVSKLSSKSEGADLRTVFKTLVPTFDEDRVHTSDMRKMINWYALLKDVVDFKEEEVVKDEVNAESTNEAAPAKEAKEKTTKAKSVAEVAEVVPAKEEKEKKTKAPKAKKADVAKTEEEYKPSPRKKATKKSAL